MVRKTVHTPIARLGMAVRKVCDQERLQYIEVSDRCNDVLITMYPGIEIKPLTVGRITKIVQAYQNPQAIHPAKDVSGCELLAITRALDIPLEDILPDSERLALIRWSPIGDTSYSKKVLEAMRRHGDRAKELIAWAEFIPCSMESPEFMRAHHERLFRHCPGVIDRNWGQLVQHYNKIGTERRNHVLHGSRTWRMEQLMLVSDLMRIVGGIDEYGFSKRVRRDQLLHLADLIVNPENRMNLILAEERDVQSIRRMLRDFDCLVLLDSRAAWWRTRDGEFSCTQDPGRVTAQRAILERFRELASLKDPQAVHSRLISLSAQVQ